MITLKVGKFESWTNFFQLFTFSSIIIKKNSNHTVVSCYLISCCCYWSVVQLHWMTFTVWMPPDWWVLMASVYLFILSWLSLYAPSLQRIFLFAKEIGVLKLLLFCLAVYAYVCSRPPGSWKTLVNSGHTLVRWHLADTDTDQSHHNRTTWNQTSCSDMERRSLLWWGRESEARKKHTQHRKGGWCCKSS